MLKLERRLLSSFLAPGHQSALKKASRVRSDVGQSEAVLRREEPADRPSVGRLPGWADE